MSATNDRYEANARRARANRARRHGAAPATRPPAGLSAAYRVVTAVCGLLLLITGVYLVASVCLSNGFRSQWRVVLVTQLAQAMFDALQREHTTDWQQP